MNGNSQRPQSWYAPRSGGSAGRQQYSGGIPLPPGAPDFPPVSPVSARPKATSTSTRPERDANYYGPGGSNGTIGSNGMSASPRHRNSHSLSSPIEAAAGIQRSPSPRRYSQGAADPQWPQQERQPPPPLPQSQGRPYQPHPAHQWQPGHHASYSQPPLSTMTAAPNHPPPPLTHTYTTAEPTAYARPVSPRPMLPPSPEPLSHAQAGFPSPAAPHIPRVHSPQPRRNTMPAPIIASSSQSWQQPQVQTHSATYHQPHSPQQYSPSTSTHPAPPRPSDQPRLPGARPTTYSTPSTFPRIPQPSQSNASVTRRSLPKPPGPPADPSQPSPPLPSVPTPPVPSTSSLPGRFATVGATPSPSLSRSSSVASTTSVTSTGSIRRPLPRPPLPAFPGGGPSVSSSPLPGQASPLQQQQTPPVGPRSRPSASYDIAVVPPTISLPDEPPDTVATQANGLHRQMQNMSVDPIAQPTPASNGRDATAPSRQAAPPSIQLPDVPSFSFDGPGHDNDASAPVISISVAPPSPSLSKATSSDFFEPHMPPDEGIPLPSCSVPMNTSTASNGKSYAFACPGCDKPVLYGRTVNAMGKRWHPDCFQCAHCAIKLEHFEFFTKDGKPYCHVDYHELFSIRCSHCKTPIVDESYITIDDQAMGGKKTYHELHFFCANCGDPFIDPKSHSSSATNPDADGDGSYAKPFTVHNGHAYCEACNLKLHKPRCNSCRKPIEGDVLRALNKNWCDECFVCDSCRKPFEDGTFLVHQGGPHCEDCYKVKIRAEV